MPHRRIACCIGVRNKGRRMSNSDGGNSSTCSEEICGVLPGSNTSANDPSAAPPIQPLCNLFNVHAISENIQISEKLLPFHSHNPSKNSPHYSFNTALSHSKKMKPRRLQQARGQKRTLATLKTTTPPTKRVRAPVPSSPDQPADSSPQGNSNSGASNEDNQHTRRPEGQRRLIETPVDERPSANQENGASQSALTSDGILEMLKASERRAMKHVISQQRGLLTEIGKLQSLVQEFPKAIGSLQSDVAHLKVMALPGSDGCRSQRNSARSRPRNQTKDAAFRKEVVEANPTLPAELQIVFKTNTGSISAVKAIAEQLLKFHRSSEAVSITARCMNIFLYGLQKEMKKAVLKDGIGFRLAEFRFKIARIMLEQAKTLPDHLFIGEETEIGDQDGAVVELDRSARVGCKPSWLTSDLVGSNSMILARKHQECLKSELPPDPTAPQQRKAMFIAKSTFSNVLGMLRYSREKCRIRMFEDGTYCLIDWEKLNWFPRDLGNPDLSFLSPQAKEVEVSTIPETIVGDLADAADVNSVRLQTLISERKEMMVDAVYGVHVNIVKESDDGEKEKLTEIRRLRRVINILRIANSFLCAFCHLSEQDVLRTHSAMLQVLYRIALVIREMFEGKIYGSRSKFTENEVDTTRGRQSSRTGCDTTDSNSDPRSGTRNDDRRGGGVVANRNRGTNGSAPSQSLNGEGQVSHGRESGEALCGPDNGRRKTPPINVKGLMPADSDRDRIRHTSLELSVDAYNKLHLPERTEGHRTIGVLNDVTTAFSDGDAPDQERDSEDDDMFDMLED